MLGLEVVVLTGIGILISSLLAPRLRVATPVTLLAAGVLLGLIPQIRSVMFPPELVLLILLPVLLYWESLTTSLREIRRNLTAIALLSTALVIATAAAVAVTAHAFGMPLGAAWVLGAAVTPTDATAIAALSKLLPARQVTVLRAESLINDGTALVIFGVAVGVTVGEQDLNAWGLTGLALLSYGGGILIGGAVAWVNIQLRRRLEDPLLGNLVMILAPFTAFLLAEYVHASGVIAVVVSGLIMSQVAPRVIRAQHRTQALAFWPLATFLINGSLFVFVGIELQAIGRTLTGAQLMEALAIVGAVSLVVIATRFVFFFGSGAVQGIAARIRRQPELDGTMSEQVVASLAGFRGAVSLAVALSVPEALVSGAEFPARSLIIFVTAGVVLITLVGQAIALPFAVRGARAVPENRVEQEVSEASAIAFQSALNALPTIAESSGISAHVTRWVHDAYQTMLRTAQVEGGACEDQSAVHDRADFVALNLALISHRRETTIRLRDEQVIDDTTLRRLQAILDNEELSLITPEPLE